MKSLETFARNCREMVENGFLTPQSLSFEVGREVFNHVGDQFYSDGYYYNVGLNEHLPKPLSCVCFRNTVRYEYCVLTNEPDTLETMVDSLFEKGRHEKSLREEERR